MKDEILPSGLRNGLAGIAEIPSRITDTLTRTRLRIILAFLLVSSGGVLVAGAMDDDLSTASRSAAPEAPPADNVTVVTESGRAGTIIAYDPDGSIRYYNNSRTKYFDVDPVPGERMTVEYAATDTIHTSSAACSDPPCARNVIERVNLTTGEVQVVLERVVYKENAGEWHDHVRINETHVLLGEMLHDQVRLYNVETGLVEWMWGAQSDYDLTESGRAFPRDWTHLNDVSLLEDGRIMVSLRNHDRVVFIDPAEGVQKNWTLGEENNASILHEQHNPDYIPAERGGPAVVVADSEENRVREFQREDGTWERTWEWTDDQMQWPRDADRLPNGNTLVVDSHGNRVMEITPDGGIGWTVPSTMPYDAERLGTGPESATGESATALDITSRGGPEPESFRDRPLYQLALDIRNLVSHRIANAIYFVAPVWFGPAEFAAAAVIVIVSLLWLSLEGRWRFRDAGIRFRLPVTREPDD